MNDTPQFLEEWAAIAKRMVHNAGVVASEATELLEAGTFTQSAWSKYWIQMFDIAFMSTMEMAEAVMADPVKRAPATVTSDAISVDVDMMSDRVLSIASPLTRLGTADTIPARQIRFDNPAGCDADGNPTGLLPAGSAYFRVAVDIQELPSGLYAGMIQLASVNLESPSSGACKAQLLPIEIAI